MKKALAIASAFFEQKSSLWQRQHALVLIALATLALLLCYRATDTRYQFKQG